VNVHSPDEPEPERNADGIPILTDDEAADVMAGNTHCFIFSVPPRQVSFSPDGRGGIAVNTRG
jgi:hypothetical protein